MLSYRGPIIKSLDARLAIDGGTPAVPEGPPDWPLDDQSVRAAIDAAYRDGSWGRYDGPHGERLASELTTMLGVKHALPCCSGTLAVELALRGLKIGEGDEVILAAYDFAGNFRCIEAVGARPVLVDIDPKTWCLDANLIAGAVNHRTRAIIVSHLHGGLADMESLCRTAKENGLVVIEDACQAPGAMVDGKPAGSWGDVGVFSFGGSKLLTAGRGGAMVTSNEDVLQRTKIFCERGNHAFPLSELQAAVLVPQLQSLAQRNQTRLANVDQLRHSLKPQDRLQMIDAGLASNSPAYYKVAFLYDAGLMMHRTRDEFIAAVHAEGIALDAGFRGFARRSSRRCRQVGDLPNAEIAAENTLLLHHPVLLSDSETIQRVAAGIMKVVTAFSKT